MRIDDSRLRPRMTLEQFAEENDLKIIVGERSSQNGFPIGHPMRYYARFESCEIGERGFLAGVHGNGSTPEDAILDYGRKISERLLVQHSDTPQRREIQVPVIVKTHGT